MYNKTVFERRELSLSDGTAAEVTLAYALETDASNWDFVNEYQRSLAQAGKLFHLKIIVTGTTGSLEKINFSGVWSDKLGLTNKIRRTADGMASKIIETLELSRR